MASVASKPPSHVRQALQQLADGVSYYGLLDQVSHEGFIDLVERHGGRYVRYGHRSTFQVLVLGGAGLPITPAGDPIRFTGRTVVAEAEFLNALGEQSEEQSAADRFFTLRALAELLQIPEARVRAWVKAGLLKPRSVDHGVARFDFRQASAARTLVDLASAGVTVAKVRQSLNAVRRWFGNVDEPLNQLSLLERNGGLLLRLENGELSEVDGQLQIDFDHPAAEPAEPLQLRLVALPRTASDWHAQGVDQERNGLLSEAESSYRQALMEGGPDPQISFDLAHVLGAQGRRAQAVERYRQVVEQDPKRVDAWNNLGLILIECEELEAAVEALRTAVRLDPLAAESHYNLGDLLDTLDHREEAAAAFRKFLQLDRSASPWAQYARQRLEQF